MNCVKVVLGTLALSCLAGQANAGLSAGPLENGMNAERARSAGTYTIDVHGNILDGARGTGDVIFSNLQAGFVADRAFSSTDLTAVWGDQLSTAGTGRLQEFSFALFNSGTSAGTLASATVAFEFFRVSDSSSIGSFSVNTGAINLNAGFFTTLNVTGLDALNIDLDTTDIIVLQTVTALTGAANRLGVVSTTPTSVGSSVDQLYIDASTVGGGVAGFYNVTSAGVAVPFTVGYQVVVPAPGALALLGLGGMVATRRRR